MFGATNELIKVNRFAVSGRWYQVIVDLVLVHLLPEIPFSILLTASSNSLDAIRTSRSSIRSCMNRTEFASTAFVVMKLPRLSFLKLALILLIKASFPLEWPDFGISKPDCPTIISCSQQIEIPLFDDVSECFRVLYKSALATLNAFKKAALSESRPSPAA